MATNGWTRIPNQHTHHTRKRSCEMGRVYQLWYVSSSSPLRIERVGRSLTDCGCRGREGDLSGDDGRRYGDAYGKFGQHSGACEVEIVIVLTAALSNRGLFLLFCGRTHPCLVYTVLAQSIMRTMGSKWAVGVSKSPCYIMSL